MEATKDIAQILFYLVVAIVTILTYRRARLTILQPLRTEVFKLQLQEMTALLKISAGRDELELQEYFGFPALLDANCQRLLDLYLRNQFGLITEEAPRLYSAQKCPGSIVATQALVNLTEGQDHFVPGARAALTTLSPDNPLTPVEDWSTFSYQEIRIPEIVATRRKELTTLLESPLLPSECVSPLEELLKVLDANIHLLAPVLTEAAQRLPKQYTSPENINGASWRWMIDLFHHRRQALKPRARRLSEAIRRCSLAADVKPAGGG
jgi:hypothetical protein